MTAQPPLQEQLRQAIRASGRSLTQLGRAAGLDSGRLSRFMRGERDLSLSATAKLCNVLGLRLTDKTGDAEDGRTRRQRLARDLATAVRGLGRHAKDKDFSTRAATVLNQLKASAALLSETPGEGNAWAVVADVRDTFLREGGQRYRSARVCRGVTDLLLSVANAAVVRPADVEAASRKLRELGLDPVGLLPSVLGGGTGDSACPRAVAEWAGIRGERLHSLAAAVLDLGRHAKREDFSTCTHAVFDQFRGTISELMKASQEGNTRAALRDLRDTFLDGGWDRYRSAAVRRGVANILASLAAAEEVTPRDVDVTLTKLHGLGLQPACPPLPGYEEDDPNDGQEG
jgi:transcriptional regulator with XRE-family HTH domain